MTAKRKTLLAGKDVLRALSRRVPMLPEKARNHVLGYAASDMAHAYAIGVEECQREMLARVTDLIRAQEAKAAPTPSEDRPDGE